MAFIDRISPSSSSSNNDLHSSDHHRLDLILPLNRVFCPPIFDHSTGSDLLELLSRTEITSFVICRHSAKPNVTYDLLYSDSSDPQIDRLVSLPEPFPSILLSKLFVRSRSITTRFQRMPLFVFHHTDFKRRLLLDEAVSTLPNFAVRHPSLTIRVRSPTGLVLTVPVSPSSTVGAISRTLHSLLTSLYVHQRMKRASQYRLGTLSGLWPSDDTAFSSPELLIAVRNQLRDPRSVQFCYSECFPPSDFDRTAAQYIDLLDLDIGPPTAEMRALDTSLSRLRVRADAARMDSLREDPLRARMRVSDVDPPLTTLDSKSGDRSFQIALKVALADRDKSGATGVSIMVGYRETANQAISILLSRMSRMNVQLTQADVPENWVLMLPGMDEVLGGDIALFHFVAVRQALLAGQQILKLTLWKREALMCEIRQKEMNETHHLPEPRRSSLHFPLVLTADTPFSLALMPGFPHYHAAEPLKVSVRACVDIPASLKLHQVFLQVAIIHGTSILCETASTNTVSCSTTALFNHDFELALPIRALPRTARIAFTLFDGERTSKGLLKPIATYNFPAFTFDGWLNTGDFTKAMWGGRGLDFFLTTVESNEDSPIRVLFTFNSFHFPIGFVNLPKPPPPEIRMSVKIVPEAAKRLDDLRSLDPLEPLKEGDRELLWKYRYRVSSFPELLPLVLMQINYADPNQVSEVPYLLQAWVPPSPTQALALFDAKFADDRVRAYAVGIVETFHDHEMRLYLLQLVQALKYQLYDDSALAQFLIGRGLAEPKFFGHQLFWQLMSEAHLSHIRQRFSRLLVHFIYGMGAYLDEMIKGYKFTKQLVELNHRLGKCEYSAATGLFRQELTKIEIPREFHLPMDPRLVVDSFIIEKCKVMNSKKRPFWLAFHNSSPFATDPVYTLFKVGDDLRQDQLTLQVLKVMEYLWRQKGHEFHMRCYGVLPTGFEQGFIEVVPNAVTESELQKERGTFAGVWATDLFTVYLSKYAAGKGLAIAREIFRLSSAAYAVATSVLGIADRHPGNIMVQQSGHFFHIDFGHFLGNWKAKYGVKREGDLFHFSPACANAIGDDLKEFEQNTRTALGILRENATLLITLFLLMMGTGIPELRTPQDIDFLKQKLYLKATEQQANAAFGKLIKESMESTRTKLNNWVHNIKQ